MYLLLQMYLPHAHVAHGHVLPPGAGPGLRPIHGGYYPAPHPPPPAALPLPTYSFSKPVYAQPPPV